MAYNPSMFSGDRSVRRLQVEVGHTPTARVQDLTVSVNVILRHLHAPERARQSLEQARCLLQILRVSVELKVRAARHLQNADQYLSRGESGAARWELDALRHVLARQA